MKSMKNIFTILSLMLGVGTVAAQQAPQYSLYMFNKYAFNPAYAGMDNSLSMTGVYRNQWVGLDGSPETQSLNAHTPLYIAGGGAGIGLESETIGSWKQTSFQFSYAYQIPFRKGVLSLGLSGGLVQRQLDGSKVETPGTIYDDKGNPIDHQDPLLTTGELTGAAPVFNAGAWYQGEHLEAGLSVINLSENEIDLSLLTFKPERALYFFLAYHFDLNASITINPSVLVKSDVQQTQMDFSVFAEYNENIFAGATFRGYNSESRDAIAVLAGFKLSEHIKLAYAYDFTLSKLNTVSNGSHEIVLNYNLGKPIGKGRPPKIIYNPRSL
jgi:type IX secretion system PorP/SprF family membrane protein